MKPPPEPTPDQTANRRTVAIWAAVLCGLTAVFLWLFVTRVVMA